MTQCYTFINMAKKTWRQEIYEKVAENVFLDDKEIQEARKVLGKTAEKMSDEELKDQITMMKFLTESWLDEYERSVYGGKTLAEKIPGFNAYKIKEELTAKK